MPRSSAAIPVLLAVVLAGCQQAGAPEAGGIPESASVPLLQPHSPYAVERDDPPALKAELERQEREGMALLRKAAHAHADAAGGCVHTGPGGSGSAEPKRWVPRPPRIVARLLGRQVQVDVELQGNPTSLACRPMLFWIVVSSGQGGTSSFNNLGGVGTYRLFGPGVRAVPRRFRVIGHIPLGGAPPYHLSASTESPRGQSTHVEQVLRCPTTADTVRGCLNGIVLKPHAVTIPSPVLPLRGVTTAALARSMNDVFAWDPHPHANGRATCTAITDCRVPFADPLRGATGTARYRIQGEQVAGCWLGTLVGLERSPAQAEVFMPESVGGCVTWQ